MTPRQRFQAVMNFQPFDRLPVLEWAMWWDKTIARWHAEGLPARITDRYDLYRYFDLEMYLQDWLPVRGPTCPQPPSHGAPIIPCMPDAYRALRAHLYPEPDSQPERWAQWERWARRQERGEAVLWFTVEGFFWFARTLLGIEPHLYAFYDAPELLHQINADLARWQLKMIDRICSICTPDFMTFAEDLSYNNGPMLSQDLFDQFLKPYYDMVVPALQSRGILPLVDSDGDVTLAAPWFARAGLAGILPLERQAGVDVARLRATHPRMRFIGHFDKMTMTRGQGAMRAEFERLLPTAARGGFLISCDHQTPPGVSLAQYRSYLDLFREYAQEAGRRSAASPKAQAVPGLGSAAI